MSPALDIAVKAAVAAVFFYVLQVVGLGAKPETGVLWAIVGGIGAAYLAWSQARRGR